MGLLSEFKAFAVKGNVVDMAVGIIIGAAFGKIVSSFVGDVIMPPIGLLIGGVDFSDLAITLKAAEGDVPAVVLAYGKFIQTILDFVIVAFAIFMGGQGDQPPQARRSRRAVRTASAECRGNPADRDPRSAESPAEQVVIASAEQ
ncbi:large-conductance mechanosensitive channel [Pseudomonas aeruginosa]|nr:large-conductance mechanosensitive channel [Pseudomonas aeruginosa]